MKLTKFRSSSVANEVDVKSYASKVTHKFSANSVYCCTILKSCSYSFACCKAFYT